MTEDFFEKLLNFGSEWKVERVEFNESSEVDIFLKWDLQEHKKIISNTLSLFMII